MNHISTEQQGATDADLVLYGGNILDVRTGNLLENHSVLVADGTIQAIVPSTAEPRGAQVIDVSGMTVLPGLIDSHSHVMQVSGNFVDLQEWSPYYVGARAAGVLGDMLQRGFTTVRDMGGADAGIARAVNEGLIVGPAIKFGGPIFAPTGGHALTVVCDGEVEIRRALRKEFRDGADHIKLTVSGGVISKMRMEALGFSEAELRVAVDEANLAQRYIAAHAYTAEAVNRALVCGIRSIEHGNFLDERSIELFLEHDAFYVPTLATFAYLTREENWSSLPVEKQRKLSGVLESGLDSLDRAHRAGVKIAYGTDLHGEGHSWQLAEFQLRAKVIDPLALIQQATINGAELLNLTGQVGEVAAGHHADLLVVDANPLMDISAITADEHRRIVVAGGRVVRYRQH
ncbi:metal-dependent hydrolase family protein [Paeniglutamicibacter kerguelensis]|uniref:Imidazolonepropionase-like amidohydrolase n=1 Tax=Paeniglutamicibacter kerguelensis TaxID=254788 RepID=A0ABS4XFE4_9MICC|nr:amidohydrolase family protein [Paeniglutamicibacter kerguelensis]MBP2387180.1 imidazolonepropionase-like amidohydrolase [Paeniglutamicibacter kerguelensis]